MTNADYNPEFDPVDVDGDYGSTGGDITVPTFNQVKPFKFWCQKALPLVYDDSLSYYELLCRVVAYLNNMMTDLNSATSSISEFAEQFVTNQTFLNNMAQQLGDNTEALKYYINERMEDFSEAYQELEDYVNNYFNNLDVQEEIDNKLDEMSTDGTFDEIFLPFVSGWITEKTEQIDNSINNQNQTLAQQNGKIAVLEGRMDTFSQLPAGSTSANAELVDIRTNFLGVTFANAGDAVRTSDFIASGYNSIPVEANVKGLFLDGSEVAMNGDFSTYSVDITPFKGGKLALIFNAYNTFDNRVENGDVIYGKSNVATPADNGCTTFDLPVGGSLTKLKTYTLTSGSQTETRGYKYLLILPIPANETYRYYYLPYTQFGEGDPADPSYVYPPDGTYLPNRIVYGTSWYATPIDATLTHSGESADAKVTGDAISELNERLNDIIDTNILYNEDSVVVSGSGQYVFEVIYELTPISGKTYSFQYDTVTGETTTSTVGYIRAYTGSAQTASINLRKENKIATYTVPNGITKLEFILYPSQSGGTTATYTGVIIFEGVVPTLLIKQNVIPDFVITPDQTTFFRLSKNLVNPETTVEGEYINQTNGTVSDNANYTRTDYVRVKPNTEYIIETNRVGYSQDYRLAFYTNDKQFISGNTLQNATYYIITTPANCYYIRCSTSTFYFPIMIAESETEIAYEEYGVEYIYPKYILGENIDNIFINIPNKIYAVTGIETNIYFENITENWENYSWNVDCTKGMQLERGYRITPSDSDAGTYSLTISASLKNDLSKKTSKTVSLIIKGSNSNSGVSKKVLVLGDSTTANGTVIQKLNDNFTDDVMTIETIGTLGTSPNNMEGRSGWTATDYCTLASSGNVTNPFYNPTSETFDAQYYFTNSGVDVPDVFVINLGINDVFTANTETGLDTDIENAISYYDTMIASIQNVSQNIVIGVCVTIPPNSSQDAFGKAYGCGQTRQIYKHNNTKWANRLIAEYGGRENENIYLIPINTNLDTKYNMGLETLPVNSRNTGVTYQSPIGNGGVHPSGSGYWQIADIYTAFLKALN